MQNAHSHVTYIEIFSNFVIFCFKPFNKFLTNFKKIHNKVECKQGTSSTNGKANTTTFSGYTIIISIPLVEFLLGIVLLVLEVTTTLGAIIPR
jgi:hypothetical protein